MRSQRSSPQSGQGLLTVTTSPVRAKYRDSRVDRSARLKTRGFPQFGQSNRTNCTPSATFRSIEPSTGHLLGCENEASERLRTTSEQPLSSGR